MKEQRMVLKLILLLSLVTSMTSASDERGGESVQQQREAKQFWTMYPHPSVSGGSPHPLASTPGGLVTPLLIGSPHESSELPDAKDGEKEEVREAREARKEMEEEEEATLEVQSRVGEIQELQGVTPEQEMVLVEHVNAMLGAMGRQNLNGVKILSSSATGPSETSSLPHDILPGRPQTSLSSAGDLGLGHFRPSDTRVDDCCLFVFFDGSAFYFDEYLRLLTGFYRLMYGSVNGHPHYVARGCKEADVYGPNCSYMWHSGQGWVIGVGTYIGQTKGVVYTRSQHACPTEVGAKWRYLNTDLKWMDDGNIVVKCAS